MSTIHSPKVWTVKKTDTGFRLVRAGITGPGGPNQLLTGKTLWVDGTNGNDGSAVRGDEAKPYLTLAAAQTAAQAGDTIRVRPGTYVPDTPLDKPNINWHLELGSVVSPPQFAGVAVWACQTTGSYRIAGEGIIRPSPTVLGISCTGPLAIVTVEGVTIQPTGDAFGVSISSGTMRLKNVLIDTRTSVDNPINMPLSGSTLTIVNCTLLAHPSRNAIEASTPQTVAVEGTLSVNRPLHANVTTTGGPVVRLDLSAFTSYITEGTQTVRQSGGVAGTDQVERSHSGSQAVDRNPDTGGFAWQGSVIGLMTLSDTGKLSAVSYASPFTVRNNADTADRLVVGDATGVRVPGSGSIRGGADRIYFGDQSNPDLNGQPSWNHVANGFARLYAADHVRPIFEAVGAGGVSFIGDSAVIGNAMHFLMSHVTAGLGKFTFGECDPSYTGQTIAEARSNAIRRWWWDDQWNLTLYAATTTSTARECARTVREFADTTDATRKGRRIESVYDAAGEREVSRDESDGSRGYRIQQVHTTAPADAMLPNGSVAFYTDVSGNLAIKLKDAGGTVRTGTVTLT